MRFEIDLDFEHLKEAAIEGGDLGLIQAAEHVRGVADEDTPIETGRLVGSGSPTAGHPADVQNVEGGAQVGITYSGPYARYQHEGLVRHGGKNGPSTYGPETLHHEHGTSKWLENAVRAERDRALAIIAKRIQGAL